MDEQTITKFIIDSFEGVYTTNDGDNMFFLYDPEGKFPFATLVINDAYDSVSDLNRPSVFRLNIGVSKQTYQVLFGANASQAAGESGNVSYDFATLDTIMPHPVYGKMYWVCVLNPSAETFKTQVQPLLTEAYQLDVAKHTKRQART